MSLQSCAELVERGDPDRFLAAMAAPPAARAVLFPLYAFNIEVTRAPWMVSEPMLGEMRLQWWRDALDEIGRGGLVRQHEVTIPLAHVLDAEGAELLDRLIVARRQDIEGGPFESAEALTDYIEETAAGLTWTAARALGAGPESEEPVRARGHAAGLARFLLALPELEARGRRPMAQLAEADVAALVGAARSRLARAGRPARTARAAVLETWRAGPLLKRAADDPTAALQGVLPQSEFARRAGLMRHAFLGR
ncbi:Squalene/phytoene synthase [Tranquillimonas rosea]|uniref:Squalene/phytoene synthase n=1 Tax=Tranquillimonas rosea TaxID=641238 RepID=A0A1H9TI21_9RHOB|nr:squalene/phytoene synthase family protein [Tranquillimonas rosea]SER96736.1 Squalene/phytoene synthase [Tranquillimonas rosea]